MEGRSQFDSDGHRVMGECGQGRNGTLSGSLNIHRLFWALLAHTACGSWGLPQTDALCKE